ncbi:lipopolysaccharide export system protein LptC [Marinobacterium nitratireducens]|uniref:Lipopolysaccharide export system protein LptC n=1 Tax=Marinobacterium nitratireducens TaxID=518897 RepID=A0A917ZIP5_9GAMM|nr:LPS export ABC transporter periplasmic protein LptC [Marinobacterium nitratireducens]GGO82864.1 lipopolysaccharide export system protein LptC [Marinobacterium nitratireducens]
MLSSRSRLALATALLAPVLLYWGFDRGPSEPEVRALEGNVTNTDFYLRDARIQQFDADGRLHQQLQSPELEHYPEPGLLQASEPRIELARKGSEGRISIEAAEGMLMDSNERVDLSGDVRLHDETADGPGLRLETSSLTLLPQQQYAETDARVRILAPGGETRGRGMKAYLEERKVELLSEVEGRYEN